jgi:LytS/YehU family sensor histidine kinase
VILVFAVLTWVLLWTLLNEWQGDSRFIVVELGLISSTALRAHGLWTITTYLLLAAWYYEGVDSARRTRVALRESELARRSADRWLLELRLGALQARLDPQVLFDTLDKVGGLYRTRPIAAEQLLDSLIDYLRLVLPHLKEAESTLDREIGLALAYARVLRTHKGEPLELDSLIDPSVENAGFPPMVVQPLCEMVARLTLASGEPAHLHISVSRENDGVRICVSGRSVQVPLESHQLMEVRHALSAMFAPLVRVEAMYRPSDGVVGVLIEVPYVAASSADR